MVQGEAHVVGNGLQPFPGCLRAHSLPEEIGFLPANPASGLNTSERLLTDNPFHTGPPPAGRESHRLCFVRHSIYLQKPDMRKDAKRKQWVRLVFSQRLFGFHDLMVSYLHISFIHKIIRGDGYILFAALSIAFWIVSNLSGLIFTEMPITSVRLKISSAKGMLLREYLTLPLLALSLNGYFLELAVEKARKCSQLGT